MQQEIDTDRQDFLTVAALTAPKAGPENKADKDEDLILRTHLLKLLNSYSIYYAYTNDLNFRPYRDEIPRYYLYSWK